ncbi:radical SAM protein [Candidatus Bathyarchaeota archaeon]|nr:radical SAM protein [Candidatus Bathyarchaeota archaeon]
MDIAPKDLESSIKKAREISWRTFGRKIRFYAPSFTYYRNRYFKPSRHGFPSISITGKGCSLNCKHCGGKILKTMIPAETPERLVETLYRIKNQGAVGCLISGGCLPNGSVPIDRFVGAIAEAKKLGLKVVVHTGLVNLETAEKLKEAGVDVVSIDIIGSEATIKEIYNLEASIQEYENSLEALSKVEIPFTPHVLVGLHYGELKGELNALRMISKYDPSALIIIVFFPIKGTMMENVKPPSPRDVAKVLVQARFMLPKVPIVLGCARPKGKHRIQTDVLAVETGVNGIAFPEAKAIEKALELGLDISFSPLCCSQIYSDI